jgi:aminopeptidase
MTDQSSSTLLPQVQTVGDSFPSLNLNDQKSYEKYAKKIVTDVLHLKKGENLTIEAWEHQLPFAKEVRYQARKLGANVLLFVEDDENYFRLLEEGKEGSLGHVGKHEWSLLENSDAYVFFPGPADALRQSKSDAKRRSRSTAYNQEWYRRASKAGVRGVRVRTAYVTPSRADMMGFDHQKWMLNMLGAIDVDYAKIDRRGKKLVSLFRTGKKVKIESPLGTDLQLKLRGANPHLYSGIMSKAPTFNIYSSMMYIPGSELDIVPNEKSANGSVYADRPTFSGSKAIEGLKFTFENGRLKNYSAEKNEALFRESFEEAKGDKDRIGGIVLGLTPKLEYGFNMDFHVEGSVTIGLGSIGEGDRNKTDYQFLATLSNATLQVDGTKVIDKGKLLPV